MTVGWVLVHSPLVGPSTWTILAGLLRQRGDEVAVPDLTGTVSGDPPYWPRQVEAIVNSADRPRILVGHSGAGPLLPAAGHAMGEIEGYVFVDADLPFPGLSWTQQAPPEIVRQLRAMVENGWLPPWAHWWGPGGLARLLPDPDLRARFAAECPPLPVAMFEEIHPPAAPGWPDAPCAYLCLSQAYQKTAHQLRELGWPVTELTGHHLAMLTHPELVLDSLRDLVAQLQR